MPVKYWSSAGLMLTYWCNARCSSCYVCSGPDRHEEMSVDFALSIWGQLIDTSPHGCRVHLTGGEPFGDWERLIELCRRAKQQNLGPLKSIETNAFWATDEQIVHRRLGELDAAGCDKLVISTDPYHQQYVPIENCRLAARVAQELWGPDRLQVRWLDWLENGFDTDKLPPAERAELFADYARHGHERFSGRAADQLAPQMQCKKWQEFADKCCKEAVFRSRHVHVAPAGRVMPDTCAGIVLGVVGQRSIADIWQGLEADFACRPVLAELADGGPVKLMKLAEPHGFVGRQKYVSKCHLCWDIRRFLVNASLYDDTLGPAWMYETEQPQNE